MPLAFWPVAELVPSMLWAIEKWLTPASTLMACSEPAETIADDDHVAAAAQVDAVAAAVERIVRDGRVACPGRAQLQGAGAPSVATHADQQSRSEPDRGLPLVLGEGKPPPRLRHGPAYSAARVLPPTNFGGWPEGGTPTT